MTIPPRNSKGPINLGFEETQAAYSSATQSARVWTEGWASKWLYCVGCGNDTLTQHATNWPASDFYCSQCGENYELKSKKGKFGPKIIDGAFKTMQQRLLSDANPSFAFLSYDAPTRKVINLFLVPKQFIVPHMIEERPPLSANARRAGWIGCNILIEKVPSLGRIHMVRDGAVMPKDGVLEQWKQSTFLSQKSMDARGWLLEVMTCCEAVGKSEFSLDEVYRFERHLQSLYPENRHVRQKIRQQLQVLRDAGYLSFIERGRYRLVSANNIP